MGTLILRAEVYFGMTTLENGLALCTVSNDRYTLEFSNSTFGRKCTPIATGFLVPNRKSLKCPLISEWANTLWLASYNGQLSQHETVAHSCYMEVYA